MIKTDFILKPKQSMIFTEQEINFEIENLSEDFKKIKIIITKLKRKK